MCCLDNFQDFQQHDELLGFNNIYIKFRITYPSPPNHHQELIESKGD